MKTRQTIFSLLFGLSLICAQVKLNTLVWTSEGKAEILSGNIAQAQSNALNNAFRDAIKKSLTETLGELTVQENARQIEENFLKDPARFVNRYKILSQGAEESIYSMEVEIELSESQIQVGLVQAGLLQLKSKAMILAIIQSDEDNLKSAWLISSPEQSLAEKLLTLEIQSWGYRLVKPEPIIDLQKLNRNLADTNWLSGLKNRYGAEILVIGRLKIKTELKSKASSEKTQLENIEDTEKADQDIYSAQAELEINVIDLTGKEKNINLKNQQIIAQQGMDQAKNLSVELVCHNILPELNSALNRLSQKIQTISGTKGEIIEITGILSYSQYQVLVQQLTNLPPVKELKLFSFAPSTVKFRIKYSGDADSLKKTISNSRFPGFRLLPVESNKKDLKFKFQSM